MHSRTFLPVVFLLSAFILTGSTTFAKQEYVATKKAASGYAVDTIPADDTTAVFEAVEKEAYFPGGEEGWRNFLEQNLNPEVPITKGAPPGTYSVMILFVVNKDGKLSNIKALTKHGYGMEAEVIRILRKSPPWVPAIQFGANVNAWRKQPVTFMVTEEKKKKRRNS